MLKQLKRWLIDVSKVVCVETIKTAETICEKTKKANSEFIKAIMKSK